MARSSTPGGGTNERGAALIEAAFATPVFLLFVFGMLEFGLLYRDVLTINNATSQGARAASVGGQRPEADFLVLRSVEHGLAAMDIDQIDVVVVFEAAGPDDTVPAACLTSSQTNICNRYEPPDFALEVEDSAGNDLGNFRCSTSAVDRFWCPNERETSISAGVEYVGVYLQGEHEFVTGLFGGSRTLTETRILRLEPETS
ncbi:MAG: TadE family protein [Actinomycetota bacterium]